MFIGVFSAWLSSPVAIGLNNLVNTGIGTVGSTIRTGFNYMTAAGSSMVLERIFGRSVVTTNNTRAVAGENANFLSNALSVVDKHSNFFTGPTEEKRK